MGTTKEEASKVMGQVQDMSSDNTNAPAYDGDVTGLLAILEDMEMKRHENALSIWNESLETVKEGNIERVMKLLNHSAVDVNLQDYWGSSLLLQAAKSGHIEIMQLLLAKGAAVGHAYGGTTALLDAAEGDHIEIVQLLLAKGTAVDHHDIWGRTALLDTVEWGHIDIAELLLAKGAKVDHHDMNGRTALLDAAEGGHFEIIELLLTTSAAVDHQDNNRRTALLDAAKWGRIDIVELLLANGADVDHHNKNGRTAFFDAFKEGHMGVVQLVLTNDLSLDHQGEFGRMALLDASYTGHVEIVELLLAKGVAVDHQDGSGRTALFGAAERGHTDIVELLLAKGATVDHHDNDGLSAIQVAGQHNRRKVVQLLIKEGAQVNGSNGHENADSLVQPTVIESQPPPTNNLITEWFIHPSEVEYDGSRKNLDGGFFTSVHYGTWMGAPVAVKTLISSDKNILPLFYKEVETWYRLNHPHVVKLYGAWDIGNLTFACEDPANESLDKYLRNSSNKREAWEKLHEVALGLQYLQERGIVHGDLKIDNPAFVYEHPSNRSLDSYFRYSFNKPKTWTKLYEAALGLQYLHERGIVHGDLRCSNILVGIDGVAKLTGFGWSFDTKRAKTNSGENMFTGANWKAPECFEGKQPTFASDVYSLGMCVVEALSGKAPWSGFPGRSIHNCYTIMALPYRSSVFNDQEWDLIMRMCAQKPEERLKIPDVVRELHQLAYQGTLNMTDITNNDDDNKRKDVVRVDAYPVRDCDKAPIKDVLQNTLEACRKSNTGNSMNEDVYIRFKDIYSQLLHQAEPPSQRILDNYVTLLVRFYKDVETTSQQQQLMNFAASRQRADNSYVLHHDLDQLMQLLKLSTADPIHQWNTKWESERKQQIQRFTDQLNPQTLIQIDVDEKKQPQAKTEALMCLRFELSKHRMSYNDIEAALIDQACTSIDSAPEVDVADWFIPPYEVEYDKFKYFSKGSYGTVHRGKWLNSDVVIKKVLPQPDEDFRAMFEQEVTIWFKLFHPHVVKLFGACHVGEQLFFVCEYAGHGQLDRYLKEPAHRRQVWEKLYEACLGLQYIHHRNIVHSDLKCNNILVGSDGRAKITDFGLSSKENADMQTSSGNENSNQVGAPRWKAPEILNGEKATPASDVYSFAMCIIEAVSGQVPWSTLADNLAVRLWVKSGKFPSKPDQMNEEQWDLVKRMCCTDPEQRLSIADVAKKLKLFAEQEAVTSMDVITEEQPDHPADCNYDSCGISIATDLSASSTDA